MTHARLSPAASRNLIEEMALYLLEIPDLGDDRLCIKVLITARFRATEIFDHIDAAKDVARAVRLDEANLWERLQRA